MPSDPEGMTKADYVGQVTVFLKEHGWGEVQ